MHAIFCFARKSIYVNWRLLKKKLFFTTYKEKRYNRDNKANTKYVFQESIERQKEEWKCKNKIDTYCISNKCFKIESIMLLSIIHTM